ncbi:DNA-binding transcriptional regulator, MarR family [bacterium A37T11]|nr:DNA-binding transcriptional regulator, MarR family [bacterium A37T11]
MQNDPFSTYFFLLDRTAKRVKQFSQIQFNALRFDITVDQWTVLKNLKMYADMAQRELAECCGKDQPTLTRIVDLLEKKGLVARRVHPADRRSFVVHLTEKGEQKITELAEPVAKIRVKAWDNLNESDFEHLKRILDTIYDNLTI